MAAPRVITSKPGTTGRANATAILRQIPDHHLFPATYCRRNHHLFLGAKPLIQKPQGDVIARLGWAARCRSLRRHGLSLRLEGLQVLTIGLEFGAALRPGRASSVRQWPRPATNPGLVPPVPTAASIAPKRAAHIQRNPGSTIRAKNPCTLRLMMGIPAQQFHSKKKWE